MFLSNYKKQTEGLYSSQIKKVLLHFFEKIRQVENDYEDGLITPFKAHCENDRIFTEVSENLADYCCHTWDHEWYKGFLEHLTPQSGEGIDMDPTPDSSENQQQNVGFTDLENNVIADIPHPMAYTKVDTSLNVDLGDYLKRPVQIYAKTWTIGDTIDIASNSFKPWHLFFNKASIKRKLDNYYMLRCNLHIKFVINASPFYYGCCLVSYQPLTSFNPAPIVLSASNRLENVSLSQRPHIYLYPQDSQGGDFTLPFLYHKNWLNATSSQDLQDMGTISLNSFSTLKNANGLTTDSINIKVYAWAEDIEVAGPTIDLAVQSGSKKMRGKSILAHSPADDEYSSGMISKPASAIARVAGKLKDVPIIGPFATATSFAAGAVADIAALFGYTNVPVIEDVRPFYSKPFPNLASTDIGTPVEKLTLDSKNELSIDPKITGVDVGDELTIKSFITRESFLRESTWNSTDAQNTGLFYAKVGPNLLRAESVPAATLFWGTPMSHLCRYFTYWRGDIIFRFKFICTKYHRGRIMVNWDPHGGIGTSGEYTTEVYSKIVDITEETDVEFIVPYTQLSSYLSVDSSLAEISATTSTSITGIGELFNGIITVRVLNEQTSPVTNAPITLLTFVRGADNLEFAGPRDISTLIQPFAPQSGEGMDVDIARNCIGVSESVADPNINLVYMGEHCVSIRQLMRRSVRLMRIGYPLTGAANTNYRLRSVLPRSPLYPGFDSNGFQGATAPILGVPKRYNWVHWHPTTYFALCYVGSRGSYIYSANVCGRYASSHSRILRDNVAHGSNAWRNNIVTNADTFVNESSIVNLSKAGASGQTLTNQRTQAGVCALVPMYNKYKFVNNNPVIRAYGVILDDTYNDAVIFETEISTTATTDMSVTHTDIYVGCGTDFNLVFFLNVPALWLLDTSPPAVDRP